ncbi:MAG: HPr kinase/phosphorylase [Sulfuriflexus sp.]|nr:HPr kinase/phosphorylase [Sulfuriflexus sp.]
MITSIAVSELFETHRDKLTLEHIAGNDGKDRFIQFEDKQLSVEDVPDVSFVGHMNFIHPHRIQVIGYRETAYLESLTTVERDNAIQGLYDGEPLCIIVANSIQASDELITHSNNSGIPLFSSLQNSQFIVNHLQYYLSHTLANRLTLHGVFLEVNGIGILLTGESGVGKSELALELISRGHRLIADDAPEFSRVAPDTLSGECPPQLKDFLEVRGLGILNIRAMFGDNTIKDNKYLRLIMHLEEMSEKQLQQIDRLRGSHQLQNILGVDVEQITIPVAPGRNLAVLVEIAVRNHSLLYKGYNAAESFIQRQQDFINKNN